MKIPEDKLMDTRLIHRHIDRKLVDQAAFDAHIEGLPDVSDRAAPVQVELASVGLQAVAAKDTGENE